MRTCCLNLKSVGNPHQIHEACVWFISFPDIDQEQCHVATFLREQTPFASANDIFGLPAALVGCLSQGSTDGEAKMFFAC